MFPTFTDTSPAAPDVAVVQVGLMEQDAAMNASLTKQDYLYTLISRGGDASESRVIGSHVANWLAPQNPSKVPSCSPSHSALSPPVHLAVCSSTAIATLRKVG